MLGTLVWALFVCAVVTLSAAVLTQQPILEALRPFIRPLLIPLYRLHARSVPRSSAVCLPLRAQQGCGCVCVRAFAGSYAAARDGFWGARWPSFRRCRRLRWRGGSGGAGRSLAS